MSETGWYQPDVQVDRQKIAELIGRAMEVKMAGRTERDVAYRRLIPELTMWQRVLDRLRQRGKLGPIDAELLTRINALLPPARREPTR